MNNLMSILKTFLVGVVIWGNWFIFIYYVGLSLSYVFLLLVSLRGALRHLRRLPYLRTRRLDLSGSLPPVSILCPAFNEEVHIVETVGALLRLRYPNLEVIVINDGSTDGTLKVLGEAFALRPADVVYNPRLTTAPLREIYVSNRDPRLLVYDKENGGKSDALNMGINATQSAYFVAVDADGILEEDALLRMMRPMVEDPARTLAASGIVRIVNGSRVREGRVVEVRLPSSMLLKLQIVEYLRGFLFGRAGWSHMQSMLIIAGAFGVFQKRACLEIGGYSRQTVGEDMELVVRLHRHFRERRLPYRVVFVHDPVCWTEAPATWKHLVAQRKRWYRGLLEVASLHRRMFFRPMYGRVGMASFPYQILFEIMAPWVELAGFLLVGLALALGLLHASFFLTYLLFALLLGTLLSLGAILIEEITYRRYDSVWDLVSLIVYALMENFGYRQFIQIIQVAGTFDYLRGKKGWGRVERTGFQPRAAQAG